MTEINVKSIREKGLGTNFRVLNPGDGYRKDGSLWFGECSECGERVNSSYLVLDGLWSHDHAAYRVEYCPTEIDRRTNVRGE